MKSIIKIMLWIIGTILAMDAVNSYYPINTGGSFEKIIKEVPFIYIGLAIFFAITARKRWVRSGKLSTTGDIVVITLSVIFSIVLSLEAASKMGLLK